MALCKYYMNGYCRFGNSCRFRHVDPDDQYSDSRHSGTSILKSSSNSPSGYGQKSSQNQIHQQIVPSSGKSILKSSSYFPSGDHQQSPNQNYYQRPQQTHPSSGTSILKGNLTSTNNQQPFGQQQSYLSPQQNKSPVGSKFNLYELMQVVSKDVLLAERGNQWALSCYCPIPGFINFPELHEFTAEELRWEYYISIQNNELPVCEAILQQLYANAAKVNNKLKRKETAYSAIENWLRDNETHASLSVGNSNSVVPLSNFPTTQQHEAEASSFSFSLQQPCQQPVASHVAVNPLQSTSSMFGGNQMGTEVVDDLAYSKREELSESELEAYNNFVFSFIPTKPPPRDMCE